MKKYITKPIDFTGSKEVLNTSMITPALDNVLDLNPPLKIVNDVFALKRILRRGTIEDMGVVLACMEDSADRKWVRTILNALLDDIKINILFGNNDKCGE